MVICELCHWSHGLVSRWNVTRVCVRKSSSTKPVITIPARMKKKLEKQARLKEECRRVENARKGDFMVPVITCKRKELNHYKGQTYGKFDTVPLACKGWHHKQSKGDYFTINSFQGNPAIAKIPEEEAMRFDSLRLSEDVVKCITDELGFGEPTHIQAMAIPHILSGENTVVAAETGSGKTVAFLAPLIEQILQMKQQMLEESTYNSPIGLVLTPSRELAQQIGAVAKQFSFHLPITTKVLLGGRTKSMMKNPPMGKPDLLISSLGVISKLTTTGVYKTNMVRHIVLDEADTLLDDSFNEKLVHFLKRFHLQQTRAVPSLMLHRNVQLSLVGATLPRSMPEILQDVIDFNYVRQLKTTHLHRLMPHVPQKFLRLGKADKPEKLLDMVKADMKRSSPVMIFSNKSPTCDFISLFLNENGVSCINLNGQMNRELRRNIFSKFQNGHINVLSCTDIASRGLDTLRTQHVINYDFPTNMSDYIHRCGRTGRVGAPVAGHVTNFIAGPVEVNLVMKIEFSARKMDSLPNVNANIKRLIQANEMKKLEKDNRLERFL